MELTRVWEVEDVAALVSAHEDTEGLVRKVTLLKGELAEVRQTHEVVEEKFCNLSVALADGVRRLLVSEMERREQFK
jgi:hypothetical protein